MTIADYIPRKEEGRELTNNEGIVDASEQRHEEYIKKRD